MDNMACVWTLVRGVTVKDIGNESCLGFGPFVLTTYFDYWKNVPNCSSMYLRCIEACFVKPHLYLFCGLHLYLSNYFHLFILSCCGKFSYNSIMSNCYLQLRDMKNMMRVCISWALAYKKQVQSVPKSWKAQNTLGPTFG
jgi:hypothetical protein